MEDPISCPHGSSVGVTSFALPEAKHSQKGVSVEYVPDPEDKKKWFVFRASYRREIMAVDQLILDGVYAYVAVRKGVRRVDGKLRHYTEPLISNLVFAYLTEEQARAYVYDTPALTYLSFYYNHFQVGVDFRNPPLTVSQREMCNFILATHTQNEHIRLVNPDTVTFKTNDQVRVTQGEFQGVCGRVARIAGQQRVVVQFLDSLIATAYIPTAFLEAIS